MGKGKKKTQRAKRAPLTAKTVQLQLRATTDELVQGKCILASKQLISAAHTLGVTAKRKNKRMTKVRENFAEVVKVFERVCMVRSSGLLYPLNLARPQRVTPQRPMPQIHNPMARPIRPGGWDMSYQAGPRHPLPGRRPDVHPVQAAPYRPPPSYSQHTHPFVNGLGGLRKRRR